MDNEFDIKGRKFKVSKIGALAQFHIVRRIAPILGELGPIMVEMSKSKAQMSEMTEDQGLDAFAKVISPVMNGLSKLNDKDGEAVLFGLLSAVEMQQERGNWAKLSNGSGLMFDSLDFPTMIQAAGRAFAFNLAGFFQELPRAS